ncbi:MAG: hypothetical protein COB24_14085 [Hyphomicrobiales bacterium]|nr:MAG: hypothetical protein COB24_14085 [Hyphomicrobiales bacterium]
MIRQHALKDPRTIARANAGIFDTVFPQLNSGLVGHFNREIFGNIGISHVRNEQIKNCSIGGALLFEIALVRAEQQMDGVDDWENCLTIACERQSKYFDAKLVNKITKFDKIIAETVASNLSKTLRKISLSKPSMQLIREPVIPGFHWISSGVGDYSIGNVLIEVKCTRKRFGISDYRQIIMYWLLSYISFLEKNTPEWRTCLLINPRLNHVLKIEFDELISTASVSRSKLEIVEFFTSLISDHSFRLLESR